jgi:hypothetical protein
LLALCFCYIDRARVARRRLLNPLLPFFFFWCGWGGSHMTVSYRWEGGAGCSFVTRRPVCEVPFALSLASCSLFLFLHGSCSVQDIASMRHRTEARRRVMCTALPWRAERPCAHQGWSCDADGGPPAPLVKTPATVPSLSSSLLPPSPLESAPLKRVGTIHTRAELPVPRYKGTNLFHVALHSLPGRAHAATHTSTATTH